ncbi:MAG: putative manganese-dependent inorganic diphosphatase [Bacilli bacterium]|nr:putative manganese-dependent inorganic diphosphatase [Bacilli bacterium]MDD4407161.1 putative manganese-dependent inorganic diphosphatase [Bacilli bacterium]
MEKIFVIGHKKPDTDSVCGAIALSYLKNQMGLNTEPRILSEINSETLFVLNKFNMPVPKYLNDVKVQLNDVKYKKNFYINEDESIFNTYNYISEKEITGIPIVDDKKYFLGYVSLKEIAKELIVSSSNEINTSFDNIASTLSASKVYKFDEDIIGKAITISIPYRMLVNTIKLSNESIIIGCNRNLILNHALKSKVKLIILINNKQLTEEEERLAKENKVNIIITPFDTFKVTKIISLSNPIKTIQRATSAICFEPNDYLTDFIEISNKYKHTNYPIINSKGICEGMLRVIDTHEFKRKNLILVDHNESNQSVDGLNEANILEIVDHHNIGNISTSGPINFRNMTVGSVNTVIYYLFMEQSLKIPKNIAGIMLSGIISDTLLLASPTTTMHDKLAIEQLAKIAKIEINKYGLELLKSGVSIKGMSIQDIINKDFKTYMAGDNKVGVAQVFTTSFDEYKFKIKEYINELNKISTSNNYKVVCLFITDILNNNSYIIFNESGRKYLEEAYNINELTEGYLFEGVVSRKKQMVPLIIDVIEKL